VTVIRRSKDDAIKAWIRVVLLRHASCVESALHRRTGATGHRLAAAAAARDATTMPAGFEANHIVSIAVDSNFRLPILNACHFLVSLTSDLVKTIKNHLHKN
jgi:hypothetical protein